MCRFSSWFGDFPVVYPQVLRALERAAASNPPVIWIQEAGDNGCLVSLLNTTHPTIAEVLLKIISLQYNPTIMAGAGKMAISHLDTVSEKTKGNFILVVEGAIPTKDGGIYCTIGQKNGKHITMLEAVKDLGPKAKAIIALGACATHGGIPAGKPNPTGAKAVRDVLDKTVPIINIPGCPAHPDWFVGTLVHLLMYGLPELDDQAKPKMFFADSIHQNCPNYSYYMEGQFASKFGEKGCLIQLGCKGPMTYSDCPLRRWNSGVEWCIGAGLTEAPRGSVGHWISIKDKRIERYQVITPTVWNASPKDDKDQPGAVALIGTKVKDNDNPFELVRIVRAFDPCLACSVHLLDAKGSELGVFNVV